MLLDFLFSKGAFGMLLKCQLQATNFTEGFSTNVQFLTEGFTKGPLKECQSGEFNKCGPSAVRNERGTKAG